jgi:hypothetical protein
MRALQASLLLLEPQVTAHARQMFEVLSDPALLEFENEPPQSSSRRSGSPSLQLPVCDAFLQHAGVCRDFAHMGVALYGERRGLFDATGCDARTTIVGPRCVAAVRERLRAL